MLEDYKYWDVSYVSDENLRLIEDASTQLLENIKDNETKLSEIIAIIDNNIKLPKKTSDTSSYDTQNNDSLKYILNQKYHLDDMCVEDSNIDNIENPRIRSLLFDIKKLGLLKESRIKRNEELKKILDQFECFTNDAVLPYLRKDIVSYQRAVDQKASTDLVEKVFSEKNKLWTRYAQYSNYTHKLKYVCNELMCILERNYPNEDMVRLEIILEKANELRNKLDAATTYDSRLER